jgi:hypothetical protein
MDVDQDRAAPGTACVCGPRPTNLRRVSVKEILRELAVQRWDDHRYYHHSRINQSLHLLSAVSFLVAYVLLFINPAAAAILGWCVSMTSRQAGHFFFEPRGYDEVNQATDEFKEAVKIGYNIRRKIVLMAAWLLLPLVLWATTAGNGAPIGEFLHTLGMWWLALAVAGLLFRVGQLWVTQNLLTGLTWALKILTDPFHDVALYYKAPLYLLRGELIDPMTHVHRP